MSSSGHSTPFPLLMLRLVNNILFLYCCIAIFRSQRTFIINGTSCDKGAVQTVEQYFKSYVTRSQQPLNCLTLSPIQINIVWLPRLPKAFINEYCPNSSAA